MHYDLKTNKVRFCGLNDKMIYGRQKLTIPRNKRRAYFEHVVYKTPTSTPSNQLAKIRNAPIFVKHPVPKLN